MPRPARSAGVRRVPGPRVGKPPPPRIPGRDDRPPPLALPLRVRFAGLYFDLDTAPVGQLWAAYAASDWPAILPGLATPAQQRALWARLGDLDDPLDINDAAAAARRVGAALAGVDFQAAARIAGTCEANRFLWLAWTVRNQLDPDTVTLPRLLAAGYAFLLDGSDDVAALDKQVWAAAPGLSGPRWGASEEARAFAEAMAAMGGRRPA